MTGIGTIVNVAAVIAGGGIGYVLRGGLKQHYQDAVVKVLGLSTMFIGASGGLAGMFTLEGDRLGTQGAMGMIFSLVLGTLLGELLDFDGKLEALGCWLKEKASRGEDNLFVEGFVTASLTVCIGAMAIVGSLQDALLGDPTTLFTKSILDFMILIIFASTYGLGPIFSCLPVAVLQGGVTLCAGILSPLLSPAVIANLSFLGSILIFCVGVNLAFGNRFRVANMLPALVVGGVYVSFFS